MDPIEPDAKLVSEAETWLVELLDDLKESRQYEKIGYGFYQRVRDEIRRYDPSLQQAVSIVVGNWIEGDDVDKAADARNIAVACSMAEHIPRIRKILFDVRAGKRRKFLVVSLEEQIRQLEAAAHHKIDLDD